MPIPTRMRLAKMCINMYAGEMDTEWLEAEKTQAAQFRKHGIHGRIQRGEGARSRDENLEGPGAVRLFKQFEQAPPRLR